MFSLPGDCIMSALNVDKVPYGHAFILQKENVFHAPVERHAVSGLVCGCVELEETSRQVWWVPCTTLNHPTAPPQLQPLPPTVDFSLFYLTLLYLRFNNITF